MSARRETKTVLEWQQRGVLLVEDGNHGENRPRKDEFGSEGVAFIRAADMANGSVLFGSAQKINAVAQARVRKGIGSGGDILISHKGTIGRVARVPTNSPSFVCSPQTTFWRVLDPQRLDAGYLYVLMRSPTFQGEFAVRSGETDMAGYVSLTSQRALQITVPPLAEQRSIAAVLGTLDDRIELNRRMSATLEEMARALFRSWFVDFDPVHAKARGEVPAHMDAATAALFPDSFGEDGLPDGWRLGQVSGLIDFNPRETLKKGVVAPYLDMKAVPTFGHRAEAPVERAFGSGTKFRRGDVLLARITPCLENGKTALVDNLAPGNVGWGSTEFIVLRGRASVAPGWVYCLSRDEAFRACAIQSMVGSSGRQRVQQERLEQFPVAISPMSILQVYGAIVAPIFERMRIAGDEIDTLAALRDALLPKLMSGELRVRDAERQIAEAV